ncbi:hypothetical protein DFH09DRAFT_328688 [Mycena vulgaris]|nr:hypothetical protein DFH09DRAFT_328688 [Mycena vulgaris]
MRAAQLRKSRCMQQRGAIRSPPLAFSASHLPILVRPFRSAPCSKHTRQVMRTMLISLDTALVLGAYQEVGVPRSRHLASLAGDRLSNAHDTALPAISLPNTLPLDSPRERIRKSGVTTDFKQPMEVGLGIYPVGISRTCTHFPPSSPALAWR